MNYLFKIIFVIILVDLHHGFEYMKHLFKKLVGKGILSN